MQSVFPSGPNPQPSIFIGVSGRGSATNWSACHFLSGGLTIFPSPSNSVRTNCCRRWRRFQTVVHRPRVTSQLPSGEKDTSVASGSLRNSLLSPNRCARLPGGANGRLAVSGTFARDVPDETGNTTTDPSTQPTATRLPSCETARQVGWRGWYSDCVATSSTVSVSPVSPLATRILAGILGRGRPAPAKIRESPEKAQNRSRSPVILPRETCCLMSHTTLPDTRVVPAGDRNAR